MIRVLPPWFENLGKRIVKSPKVFLRDSGILHFLFGLKDRRDLQLHPRYGASWEGFALEQTLLAPGERDAFFYATQRSAEMDLLPPAAWTTLGVRVQMHGRAAHDEIHARRDAGSGSGAPPGAVSRGSDIQSPTP